MFLHFILICLVTLLVLYWFFNKLIVYVFVSYLLLKLQLTITIVLCMGYLQFLDALQTAVKNNIISTKARTSGQCQSSTFLLTSNNLHITSGSLVTVNNQCLFTSLCTDCWKINTVNIFGTAFLDVSGYLMLMNHAIQLKKIIVKCDTVQNERNKYK